MLFVGSALKSYAILATDGGIGVVSDLLFDDRSWKVRWVVVDTGSWLSERKVLIHPSAIGATNHGRQELSVNLSRAKIEGSPEIFRDPPVTLQMQTSLYDYYGWDPLWAGGGLFGGDAWVAPLSEPGYLSDDAAREMAGFALAPQDGDPHLRSMQAVIGYHMHATDGTIGHVENFLIEDSGWDIRYLIVDTRNWWFGQHVLMSPHAVREIDWSRREVKLDVSREKVKASPPWDPVAVVDRAYQQSLHGHYAWPGYGW